MTCNTKYLDNLKIGDKVYVGYYAVYACCYTSLGTPIKSNQHVTNLILK